MKVSHVPGPWIVDRHESVGFTQIFTDDTQPERVCMVGHDPSPLRRRKTAALIAAAPEMIAALKTIAEPLDFTTCVGDPWSFYCDLQAVASAAISKAEITDGAVDALGPMTGGVDISALTDKDTYKRAMVALKLLPAVLAVLKAFRAEFGDNLENGDPMDGDETIEAVGRVWEPIRAAIAEIEAAL